VLARLATALGLAAALGACAPPEPPSVIVVSVDTLRRDRLNCYGYRARTLSPNIDALAADSVLFENAVAAAPWTTPSHMSLFTSLAPSSHGITTSFRRLVLDIGAGTVQALPESRVTLAEALAGHGFRTAAFTGGSTLAPAIGFGQGFSVYDTSMVKMSPAGMGRMKAWVGRQRGRPFFLFWHTFEVHNPYLDTRFVGEVLPAGDAREVEGVMGEVRRRLARSPVPPRVWARLARLEPHFRELSSALYDGGVASMDRWVGDLVGFLRQSGLYESALIVFTSDHGEELWDRAPGSLFGAHGHTLYDEMVRVPLLIKLPGRAYAGARVAAPAGSIDVMPTVLDVLGLPPAAEAEGRSLRPLWEGRDSGGRIAFSEALAFDEEKKSVRTARFKYILAVPPAEVARHGRRYVPREAQRQLFDLMADPGEHHDLLSQEGAAAAPAGETLAAAEGLDGDVQELDRALREHVGAGDGDAVKAQLSEETMERLRALGYVE
jgi:arylsulfatase A-like enzyme